MIRDTLETKPAAMAFLPLGLSPEALELWMDCVLAWPFWSIGESHVEDAGPNKLHGVMGSNINPATDWIGSPYGAALKFTGQTEDKLTVADPTSNLLDGTSKLSLELLFRPNVVGAAGVNYGLVGKYRPTNGQRSWRLQLDGDELSLQVSNDGTGNEEQKTTNANLVAGTWYHLVLTYNAGVWKAYLNGVLLTTDGDFTTHTSIFAGAEELKVGQRTTSGGSPDTPLTGDIASLRIWNPRVLTAEDATMLWERKWEMYDRGPAMLGWSDELTSGAAAGPWVLAARVAKGVQAFVIGGVQNGTSYDVRARPIDKTGNQAAGNTPVAGTPTAGQALPPNIRNPIPPPVLPPEVPWIGRN